jgi:hypothetical protein
VPLGFWEWFRNNSEALKRIRSANAPEYIELQRRVAQLSPDIDAEIGGSPSGDELELIFTSHGERRCFPLIDQIVGSAPPLDGWRIRALKPPLLEDLSVQYGDQKITTREIWLKVDSKPDTEHPLRLRVAVRREDHADRDPDRESAALLAIESFLGERAYASQISVDCFVDLPTDPGAEGFVSLRDVADRLQLSRLQ